MKFYQNDGKLSLAGQALFNAVKLAIRRVLPRRKMKRTPILHREVPLGTRVLIPKNTYVRDVGQRGPSRRVLLKAQNKREGPFWEAPLFVVFT